MSTLHPHWQATPEDDVPVRVATPARPARNGKVSIRPASRLPAAIVGILAVAIVGITLNGGWDMITAQIGAGGASSSSSSASTTLPVVQITITASGFDPASVTVQPGQTIVWTNQQSIPHILTSQTLRDGSGVYLNTPAIFPGSTATFTVGPHEPNRQNSVTSTTDQTLVGTVIVNAPGSPVSSSSVSTKKQPFGSLDGVNLPTGQGSSGAAGFSSSKKSSSSSFASSKSSSIPLSAFGSSSSSLPLITGTTQTTTPPPATQDQNIYAPVTPQPLESPHTGPGLWIVSILSLVAFCWMTRKYVVRI